MENIQYDTIEKFLEENKIVNQIIGDVNDIKYMKINKLLGSGAMGTVYNLLDKDGDETDYVIKITYLTGEYVEVVNSVCKVSEVSFWNKSMLATKKFPNIFVDITYAFICEEKFQKYDEDDEYNFKNILGINIVKKMNITLEDIFTKEYPELTSKENNTLYENFVRILTSMIENKIHNYDLTPSNIMFNIDENKKVILDSMRISDIDFIIDLVVIDTTKKINQIEDFVDNFRNDFYPELWGLNFISFIERFNGLRKEMNKLLPEIVQ